MVIVSNAKNYTISAMGRSKSGTFSAENAFIMRIRTESFDVRLHPTNKR